MNRTVGWIATAASSLAWHGHAAAEGVGQGSDEHAGGGALMVLAFVALMYLLVSVLRGATGTKDRTEQSEGCLDFDKRTRSLTDPIEDRT